MIIQELKSGQPREGQDRWPKASGRAGSGEDGVLPVAAKVVYTEAGVLTVLADAHPKRAQMGIQSAQCHVFRKQQRIFFFLGNYTKDPLSTNIFISNKQVLYISVFSA